MAIRRAVYAQILWVTNLKIDWIPFPQSRLDLGDRTEGVSLEVVKIGNSVLVEERSRHRPMKSNGLLSISRRRT